MVVRTVKRPWRLGDYVVRAARRSRSRSSVCIIATTSIRVRTFTPERFLNRKPGTYTWIPFGGGIRRCLGATLAMAEQRVVLAAIARRTDLVASDRSPEAPRMRNVTMLPSRGGRVLVAHRRSA